MDGMDDETLLAAVGRRVLSDLALMDGLLSNEALLETPGLGRLRARLKAVSLGTESMFLDASLERINLTRYLQACTGNAARLAGGDLSWKCGLGSAMVPCGRAVVLGLAFADLAYSGKGGAAYLVRGSAPETLRFRYLSGGSPSGTTWLEFASAALRDGNGWSLESAGAEVWTDFSAQGGEPIPSGLGKLRL